MTQWQKVIKYIAIILACGLLLSIVSGIFGLLTLFGWLTEKDAVADMTQYTLGDAYTSLDMEIHGATLTIQQGDGFRLESNLKNLKVQEKNGVLRLQEKQTLATNYTGAALILTVPEDYVFTAVSIETGAGNVYIQSLSAQTVELELGAGQVTIEKLTATQEVDIQGGAGKMTVQDGSLTDLELDMGVGKLELTAALLGNSQLNCGIGDAVIVLLGEQADYSLSLQKGLGAVSVNGEEAENGAVYGTGTNRVSIQCGVGTVTVDFT